VAGAVCISTSSVVMVLAGSSASVTALGRAGFALPVLGLLAWLERRRGAAAMSGRSRWLARIGGAFLGADLISWSHTIDNIGAGLSTVLTNLQVVVVVLLAWALLGERPRRALLVALPVMLGGLVLVGGLAGTGGYGAHPVLGAVYGVLTAVLYSVYILMLRRATTNAVASAPEEAPGHPPTDPGSALTHPPTELGSALTHGPAALGPASGRRPATPGLSLRAPIVAPLFEATIGTAAGALVLGFVFRDFRLGPAWPALGWLIVLALTSQVLGWLLITMSMPKLPAWLVSSLLLVQPAGSLLLGAVFLGERPSLVQFAGVAAILAGVLIAASGRGGRIPKRAESAPAPAGAGTP
jgi:drug/metabolite transporter (DMT)-like permease